MGSEFCAEVPGGRVCVLVHPVQSEYAIVQRFPFAGGRPAERAAVDRALAVLGFTAAAYPVGHRADGSPHFLVPDAPSLSVSHTRLEDGRTAAAVYVGAPGAGVDIEVPSAQIARVAPRVFHPDEQEACGADSLRLCVVWCTKEATWKGRGPGLSFADDLRVDSAALHQELSADGTMLRGVFKGTSVAWWALAGPGYCAVAGPFTAHTA